MRAEHTAEPSRRADAGSWSGAQRLTTPNSAWCTARQAKPDRSESQEVRAHQGCRWSVFGLRSAVRCGRQDDGEGLCQGIIAGLDKPLGITIEAAAGDPPRVYITSVDEAVSKPSERPDPADRLVRVPVISGTLSWADWRVFPVREVGRIGRGINGGQRGFGFLTSLPSSGAGAATPDRPPRQGRPKSSARMRRSAIRRAGCRGRSRRRLTPTPRASFAECPQVFPPSQCFGAVL